MKRDESMNIKIVSGGQTGVDRGALEAAVALGLEFGGWAPHGWIAEDGTIPAQYRAKMREHPSAGSMAQDYRERTKANVRDSHATLILVDSLPLSGGTRLTEKTAVSMMRSHKVIAMSAANAKEEALEIQASEPPDFRASKKFKIPPCGAGAECDILSDRCPRKGGVDP